MRWIRGVVEREVQQTRGTQIAKRQKESPERTGRYLQGERKGEREV